MRDWIGAMRDVLPHGPVAMVTVLATEGSAPRGAGTRMLVTSDTAVGTIGGGKLEWQACAQARAMLREPAGHWRVQDYPLGPLLGQCCGGRVRLLVEHVDPSECRWLDDAACGATLVTQLRPGAVLRQIADEIPAPVAARGEKPVRIVERLGAPRRPLYLFGAGHVGRAIALATAPLAFTLAWFDSRPDTADAAGAVHVPEDTLTGCVADAPVDAIILILTHDHDLDYLLTATALSRPFRFVGLIGSATKRGRFLARLARDGVDATRLTCPIGLPGIVGKEPEVIAIAVIAQLLSLGLPD